MPPEFESDVCYCPDAEMPHRHPKPEMFAAIRNAPTAAPAPEREAFVPYDGETIVLPSTLPPRPPAGIPPSDKRPLNLVQVTRRDSIRFALQYYEDIGATDEVVPDIDVIRTAHRFEEYIRAGVVPGHEQEA